MGFMGPNGILSDFHVVVLLGRLRVDRRLGVRSFDRHAQSHEGQDRDDRGDHRPDDDAPGEISEEFTE